MVTDVSKGSAYAASIFRVLLRGVKTQKTKTGTSQEMQAHRDTGAFCEWLLMCGICPAGDGVITYDLPFPVISLLAGVPPQRWIPPPGPLSDFI
jgi:hypothetical protein